MVSMLKLLFLIFKLIQWRNNPIPKNPGAESRIDALNLIPSQKNRIIGVIPFLGHTNGFLGKVTNTFRVGLKPPPSVACCLKSSGLLF